MGVSTLTSLRLAGVTMALAALALLAVACGHSTTEVHDGPNGAERAAVEDVGQTAIQAVGARPHPYL